MMMLNFNTEPPGWRQVNSHRYHQRIWCSIRYLRRQLLPHNLDSFDVTLTPHQPAELRSTDSARWTLLSFTPSPDYVAAAVAEGSGWSTKSFDGSGVNLLAANQEAPC